MMDKGTIFKFYNDLDTDQIIASQYLLLPNLEEMKAHTFESQDPDLAITAFTPRAFKTPGACSLEEPQPKFSPATT